ncbi:MAG: DUF1585 domain-containing protein, partial [Deltaproteobacteria bacterium]|nr:DUF1585 domain-containing protein [Deltaproteobacteria bacterium]
RSTENGTAIDTTGTLYGTGDSDGPFSGVSDLAMKMVNGRAFPNCFVKQMYRWAMGQIETSADQTALTNLQNGFSVNQPVTDLIEALISDPAFVVRNTQQVQP